jgi:glycosyltransferase involved in cell wall biosynthesis
MSGALKILVFSSLYPNAAQPVHGLFVERRLLEVLGTGRVQARVVAPVPLFPSASPRFGEYATYARVPRSETRSGLDVVHPRYPLVPKVGMSAAPLLMALATWPVVRRLRETFAFDLIDAHYYYPDGVAAALLGAWLGVPVTITARGTDINLIPRFRLPRAWIRWAARRSGASIAVCEALREEMIEIGIDRSRIRVLRNGVDLGLFRPLDRAASRADLGLDGGRWLLSVGQLIDRKGHDVAIRALPRLPGWSLLIAGDGPLRGSLESLANGLGVADRVRFAGAVPQPRLPTYYSAVDALVLASSREGWANVLLEAMACGTPVVASSVWGTPEVVAAPAAGVLMRDRTAEALVSALERLLENYPRREATRAYAESYDWTPTTRGQLALFAQLAGRAA